MLDIKIVEYLVVDLVKELKSLKELRSWDGHMEMEAAGPVDCSVEIATSEAQIKKLIKDTHRQISK